MLERFTFFILYFIAIIISSQCRKYDINEEARNLYGENLNSVLQRFRRTPEYMKILNLKLEDLKINMEKIEEDIKNYYLKQLENKIREIYGGNTTQLRSWNSKPLSKFHKKSRSILKSGSKRVGVDVLDSYPKFHSLLTLDERKRMQELGYEYFALSLHDFMANWTPDDSLPISTQQPNGGDQPLKTTTEHNHVITKQTTVEPETTVAESIHTTEKHHHHSTAAPDNSRHFRSPKIK